MENLHRNVSAGNIPTEQGDNKISKEMHKDSRYGKTRNKHEDVSENMRVLVNQFLF